MSRKMSHKERNKQLASHVVERLNNYSKFLAARIRQKQAKLPINNKEGAN